MVYFELVIVKIIKSVRFVCLYSSSFFARGCPVVQKSFVEKNIFSVLKLSLCLGQDQVTSLVHVLRGLKKINSI